MRILFIVKDIEYIDPMGIMLLSALARRSGHETFLHVLAGENLEKDVKEIKPDVVAYSAKTGEHKYYLAANKIVKKLNPAIFSIMGGPHPTFFTEVLRQSDLDAICIGEGDDAWPEFLNALQNKGDIHNIMNILTREADSRGCSATLRNKRADLDSLPFLDRDLVYRNTHLKDFPLRSYIVGRGCPNFCTYCFNHKYNELYRGKGRICNRQSVSRVCAELRYLKEHYPTQFIKFYDDVFVFSDDEWLDEFALKYPREVGLPFHCLTRADYLTESILLKLKQAGLKSISMSIEAGNDRIREDILRRRMPRESILEAFELCFKHNVPTFCNTILAIPGTGIGEDIESLDLNLASKVTFGEFPIFFPYPKTELGEYAVRHGYFDGDYEKLHMSYQSESPLKCFTPKEKLMQNNLSLLSTIVLLFPRLRNPVINFLIKLPLTKFYFVLYYFIKAYLIRYKIYPMKFSFSSIIKNLVQSAKLEHFKHKA